MLTYIAGIQAHLPFYSFLSHNTSVFKLAANGVGMPVDSKLPGILKASVLS